MPMPTDVSGWERRARQFEALVEQAKRRELAESRRADLEAARADAERQRASAEAKRADDERRRAEAEKVNFIKLQESLRAERNAEIGWMQAVSGGDDSPDHNDDTPNDTPSSPGGKSAASKTAPEENGYSPAPSYRSGQPAFNPAVAPVPETSLFGTRGSPQETLKPLEAALTAANEPEKATADPPVPLQPEEGLATTTAAAPSTSEVPSQPNKQEDDEDDLDYEKDTDDEDGTRAGLLPAPMHAATASGPESPRSFFANPPALLAPAAPAASAAPVLAPVPVLPLIAASSPVVTPPSEDALVTAGKKTDKALGSEGGKEPNALNAVPRIKASIAGTNDSNKPCDNQLETAQKTSVAMLESKAAPAAAIKSGSASSLPKKWRRRVSRYLGVKWDGEMWVASVVVDGNSVNLGRFEVEKDAARAYDKRAETLCRPMNFPGGDEDEEGEISTSDDDDEEEEDGEEDGEIVESPEVRVEKMQEVCAEVEAPASNDMWDGPRIEDTKQPHMDVVTMVDAPSAVAPAGATTTAEDPLPHEPLRTSAGSALPLGNIRDTFAEVELSHLDPVRKRDSEDAGLNEREDEDEELRIDLADGQAYSRNDFEEFYGDDMEWNAASHLRIVSASQVQKAKAASAAAVAQQSSQASPPVQAVDSNARVSDLNLGYSQFNVGFEVTPSPSTSETRAGSGTDTTVPATDSEFSGEIGRAHV